MLSSTLWLAYLLADGIAIFALGVLSNMQGDSDVKNKNKTDPNNALRDFGHPSFFYILEDPTVSQYILLKTMSFGVGTFLVLCPKSLLLLMLSSDLYLMVLSWLQLV